MGRVAATTGRGLIRRGHPIVVETVSGEETSVSP